MGPKNKINDPMIDSYIFEMLNLLEKLEELCIEHEKKTTLESESINEIFRIMHTMKSSSAMMRLNNISTLAHSLEELFFFIRENELEFIDFNKLFDLIISGIDFIKGEIIKLQKSIKVDGGNDTLLFRSTSLLKEMKASNCVKKNNENIEVKEDTAYYISPYINPHGEGQEKYIAKIFFKSDCGMENVRAFAIVYNLKSIASEIYHIPGKLINNDHSIEDVKKNGILIGFSTDIGKQKVLEKLNKIIGLRKLKLENVKEYPSEIIALKVENKVTSETQYNKDNTKNKEVERITKIDHEPSIICVNVKKLNEITDLVDEIQIYEGIVTKNPNLEGEELVDFNKAAKQLVKVTKELQDDLISIRRVPISSTFHNMNRIVRDMSKILNKEVELHIIGAETEVDKNIVDHIIDPLMQLVRNAVDHGIEFKDERLALGKQQVGKIILEAKKGNEDLFIIVSDDGKGLDRKKIYEKAKIKGLFTKLESELSDSELFSCILMPGFTMNENVTEYSGRGVGLDIVKQKVDSLGGAISIESIKGKGFKVTMKFHNIKIERV